ncbi:MAG: RagB/SusD family nutrient uptake outer membrane protein [Bacteroidales bacterium]|nr:RagB/SusD family nutrient uptake outer membrane protein [Bacteroidales bacterium]
MKSNIISIVIMAGLLFSSCEKLLEIKPLNSINADDALNTLRGNEATLIAAYDNLQGSSNYGRMNLAVPELLADNGKVAFSHANVYINHYQNLPGSHVNNWSSGYLVIRNANFVIDAIDNVPEEAAGDADKKKLLKGEAYFLRGWQHFDIARVYSREPNHLVPGFNLGIPLMTKPFKYDGTNLGEIEIARSTVEDTYELIEDDLITAFELLEGNDAGNFPNRGNALAAKAILARVYIYWEKFDEAIEAATWVIDNAASYGISIETGNYNEVFDNNSESIFQLKFLEVDNLLASSIQAYYHRSIVTDPDPADPEGWYLDKKEGTGTGELLFSLDLYNSIDNNDKRKSLMRKVKHNYLASPEEGIWLYKFTGAGGQFGIDNIPIIRLAEMYFIRAEAYARKAEPQEDLALADLNLIRNARGLTDATETGQSLRDLILAERRIEFIGEGHRFFDLKRQGMQITKSVEAIDAGRSDLEWDDYRVVARIPPDEVGLEGTNPKMIQNPGH